MRIVAFRNYDVIESYKFDDDFGSVLAITIKELYALTRKSYSVLLDITTTQEHIYELNVVDILDFLQDIKCEISYSFNEEDIPKIKLLIEKMYKYI